MANFIVVYDSCILYPFTLRTLFIELAMTGLFQAKWTTDIHQEWASNLQRKGEKYNSDYLQKVITNINATVGCLRDYIDLI